MRMTCDDGMLVSGRTVRGEHARITNGSDAPKVLEATWCPKCGAYWPDTNDGQRTCDGPPQWRLRDDPLRIEPFEPR